MPQIRICPHCKKVLQTGEIHTCIASKSSLVRCNKCGQEYKPERGHICSTMIK